jgi:hypothetical protein
MSRRRARPLRRLLAAWAAAVAVSFALDRALPAAPEGAPPPVVRYDLDAALDETAHVVHGRGTMTWRSDAKVPVDHVMLHLYLNAFRDRDSTFLSENRKRMDRFDDRHPGSITVQALRLPDGRDLLPRATPYVPEGGDPGDRTVLKVPLPTPVKPGEELGLHVEFESRLPKIVARSGFGGDFHMVTQWFPKFGVWQDVGEGGATVAGWNCHPYHAQSEFFADFGTYDVRIHVADSYRGMVGATGERVSETESGNGIVVDTFHAEAVHDFAWVCGTDYRVRVERYPGGYGGDPEEAERVARALGRSVADLKLPPVEVTFLLRPEHEDQFERHRRAVFSALTYMGLWFGPYPYSTLTVVDPDARGAGAGGMEYPTLITGGTGVRVAEQGLDPEFVLVHEFGHQHFYGLLASNEFEDAWMDEGMNTYATARTLAKAYPRGRPAITWVAGLPLYGEAPIAFPGAMGALRGAIPGLDDGSMKVPFGRIDLVRRTGEAFDLKPGDDLLVWPEFPDVPELAFLREFPPLTHLHEPSTAIRDVERVQLAEAPDTDALSGRKAWQYLDPKAYGRQSYRRTANMLRTLEGLIGWDAMTAVMRTYAERFRFRHPRPEDFFRTADEVSQARGKGPLGWFFDETVRGSGSLDFDVHEVDSKDPEPDGTVESTVTVRRLGEVAFPTTIWVGLDDGTTIRRVRWETDDRLHAIDGGAEPTRTVPPESRQYRWAKFRLREKSAVAWATVDPERLVSLDVNRLNDGRRAKPDRRAADRLGIRALGWVEMLTTFWGGL